MNVLFHQSPEAIHLPGVKSLYSLKYGLHLEFDTDVIGIEQVMQKVMTLGVVADITIEDPPLEDVTFAYIGFSIFTGSLAFFIGNAEILAEQLRGSLITFSTFPPNLFEGWVKLILFTVIPAAYVSYLPVDALHNM